MSVFASGFGVIGSVFPGAGGGGGGGGFSPLELFASGEQGGWYDPSDISTLFKDTAGTDPVTAVGDVVARINDKSGRANHATQGTLASRPIYRIDGGGRPYLELDGFNDGLATGIIAPGVDKAQMFVGLYKATDAATILLELGDAVSNIGMFYFLSGPDSGGQYSAFGRGIASPGPTLIAVWTPGDVAPDTAVLTATHDIAGDLSTIRRNAVAGTSGAGDKGAGNFRDDVLYIGARAGGAALPFNGRMYGVIVRFSAANLSTDEITATETWLANKTGVTL
jgi:hypothetical protein